MASTPLLAQLHEALRALEEADDPRSRLITAQRIRLLAEGLEQAEVLAAREHGLSWSKIGAVYGLTKQGAQQRFRQGGEPAKKVTS